MIKNNKGFTLAEVLVSSIIAIIIMVALVGLWVSSANFASMGLQETTTKNQITAALNEIQRDIMDAGAVLAVDPFYNPGALADGYYPLLTLAITKTTFNLVDNKPLLPEAPATIVYYCLYVKDGKGAITRRERRTYGTDIINANIWEDIVRDDYDDDAEIAKSKGPTGFCSGNGQARIILSGVVPGNSEDGANAYATGRPLFFRAPFTNSNGESLDGTLNYGHGNNLLALRLPVQVKAGQRTVNILQEKVFTVGSVLIVKPNHIYASIGQELY